MCPQIERFIDEFGFELFNQTISKTLDFRGEFRFISMSYLLEYIRLIAFL